MYLTCRINNLHLPTIYYKKYQQSRFTLQLKIKHTFSANGDQFHTFTGDEIKGFVDIGYLVKTHLSSVRFGQPLTCQNTAWYKTILGI